MKPVKPMLWAAALSLALGISAYAGEIQSPGVTGQNPPPPATCSDCETSVSQIEPSDTTLSAKTKSFEESDFAVDLMLALLSFF